jgi:drug/metabolite transporter (DMT)-like permease
MAPFGDAGAIYYSYPAIITLLARIFLKEPFGWFDGLTVILTVVGIFFISGPHYIMALFHRDDLNFNHTEMMGVILASIACCGISCGNLAIRKIQKTPAPVVVCWFSAFSMSVSIILVPILDQYVVPADGTVWLYILGVCISGVLTQIFVTMAFQLENAAPISITESFNMIFAFVFQYFIFHEEIKWTSGVGALLIAIAVLMIGIRKYTYSQREIKMKHLNNAETEESPPPYNPYFSNNNGLPFPPPITTVSTFKPQESPSLKKTELK